MKIFDAAQIKHLDACTIQNEPVASSDLMERAARKCFVWLKPRIKKFPVVRIFCGMGNNGGDGLAIARMLSSSGCKVVVYKIRHADACSADFALNEKRLSHVRNVHVTDFYEGDALPEIHKEDLVVDAIFGSGLSRPVEGFVSDLVKHINLAGAVVVSIDVPSGLFGEDNRNNDEHSIVKADYTLSFQFPRLAFMLASNEQFVGEWHVLDIGLHAASIARTDTFFYFLEQHEVSALLRPRSKFSHKGHFGHALLIAGSYGKAGAAVLAAKACLRSGAGLLTLRIPGCGYQVLQSCVPEAMCIPDEELQYVSGIPSLDNYNAIAAGPGMGTHESTARALKVLIQQARFPVVLDADAINILAENKTWCDFLPSWSVLTPHPREFDRLAGKSSNDFERLEKARDFSKRYQVVIALKGAHTAIISPDGACRFNSTGNPGMASGGSGDVLTGMILGFMAQQYSPVDSTVLAVYMHGLAGDLAAKGKGQAGLIAGDIVEMIPKAITKVAL